jgi:hypothetical protein
MPRQGKAQWPVHGVLNADAGRDQHLRDAVPVVPHLQGRVGIQQIQSIVRQPCEAQRLTQPARPSTSQVIFMQK